MNATQINEYNTKNLKDRYVDSNRGMINYKGRNVRQHTDPEKSYQYLLFIDDYLSRLFNVLYKSQDQGVRLLLTTPQYIQELSTDDSKFEGIAIPIGIHDKKRNDPLNFVLDNNCRAECRLVLLRLQNKNGTFRKWEDVKSLLLHELAHTMCNHLMYRTAGNHGADFKHAEALLKSASKLI